MLTCGHIQDICSHLLNGFPVLSSIPFKDWGFILFLDVRSWSSGTGGNLDLDSGVQSSGFLHGGLQDSSDIPARVFFFLLCTDALLVPYASCVIEWSLESANKISVTHVGLVLYIVDQHSAMSTALLQVLCFQQCDVPRAGDLQKSGEPNTLWIR